MISVFVPESLSMLNKCSVRKCKVGKTEGYRDGETEGCKKEGIGEYVAALPPFKHKLHHSSLGKIS